MNDKFNLNESVSDLRYSDNIYSLLEKLGFSAEGINKIKENSSYLPKDESSILNKIDGLKRLGFENPIILIEKMPLILGFTEESIARKIDLLKEKGFMNPIILIEKAPQILNNSEESMSRKIDSLKEKGFMNHIILIEKAPQILNHAEESTTRRIDWLKEKGFTNPIVLIEKMPQILSLAEESMGNKINWLKEKGVTNPIVLIEKMPSILGFAEESMSRKIDWLKEKGFMNPIVLIEKMPQILSLAEESMGNKINWLKEQGFENPIVLIEKMPSILSFAEESMNKKINYMKYCLETLSNNSDENFPKIITHHIEKNPAILGSKFDKIAVLIRILTMFKKPEELASDSEIGNLLFSNIEDLMLTLKKTKNIEDLTFREFMKVANGIKKEKIEKGKKQGRISELMSELENSKSEGDEINENLLKILKRYSRGYLQ